MLRQGFRKTADGDRSERGAVALEFALVAPIFLILVFGIIEFGRAVWLYDGVSAGAREGARYGISNKLEGAVPRHLHCAGIRDAARARTPDLDLADADIKIEYRLPGSATVLNCDTDQTALSTSLVNATRIEVTVNAEFDLNLPLVPLGPFTISATDSRSIYNGKDAAS
jgi:Flp pilus assembly protein TadG